jgi:hypothetical protein
MCYYAVFMDLKKKLLLAAELQLLVTAVVT